MKNILIVMPSGQMRGGAEEALLRYVAHAGQVGHRLTVAVLEKGPMSDALRERGAEVVFSESGQLRQIHLWLRVIWKIRTLAKQEKSDFIFSWITKGHLYGGPAAFLARKPAGYFQMGLPDNGSVDRLCRAIPAVGAVGCSSFVAQEQSKQVPYPVLPVPLAADLTRFEPARDISMAEMKTRLGFDPARPLVGMVGRLQHWKGMHVFAEAFAALQQEMPEVQGVIVGGPHEWEPEYEEFLKRRVDELGLKDKLKLVGPQRNVPEWMQAMDVFVHASEREPFGIVIVEAMSLGKPVIATIPGGPAEIIEPDSSGQLVVWNDAAKLTGALKKFLTDSDFARKCGEAAEKRAQLFSIAKFYDTLNAALNQLYSGVKPSEQRTL